MNSKAWPADDAVLPEAEIQARFDGAVQRGNRNWLWPELPIEEWKGALDAIADVASQVLADPASRPRLAGDPAAIGIAGYTCGLGPLLAYWHREQLIATTDDIGTLLSVHYRHNAARMNLMASRAVEVVERLAANRIRPIMLKGMDTAFRFFPLPATRPLSDIDLLIDPGDEPAARRLLLEMGFVAGRAYPYPRSQEWRKVGSPAHPRTLSFVHADDPWSIDLQLSLNRQFAPGAPVVELDRLRASMGPRAWSLSPQADTLPPAELVLQLACHASCPLRSLTLLRLVELALVVRQVLDQRAFSWDEFLLIGAKAGALAHAYPALRLCAQLVPDVVPPQVVQACARQVPRAVRQVVERVSPAHAQSIVRCSLKERFMWTPLRRAPWQVLAEVFPPGSSSLAILWDIYRARAWRVARGTLTAS